jgi:small subunit ribosomal protein S9
MSQKQNIKKEAPKGSAPLAHGVGRRKKSVARVWLRRGTGNFTVNERAYDRYFDTEIAQYRARVPFEVYSHTSKYDIDVNVYGGGLVAQADAVKLGIARALVEANPDIRSVLRDAGLLTVDSRVKERKKYGQRAARARFQFTKR